MKIKTSFSIVGIPRSGTTLLERLLDAHSEITVCPENMFFGHVYRYGASASTKDYFISSSILADTRKDLSTHNDKINVLIDEKFGKDDFGTSSIKEILLQLVEDYTDLDKVNVIGEKTPEHLFYLSVIMSFCPIHKIIFIKRNPLDCCYSICKAMRIVHPRSIDRVLLLKSASIVKTRNRVLGENIEKYKANSIAVNYEQLVTQPEKILTDICQFLNVRYEKLQVDKNVLGYFVKEDIVLQRIHEKLSEPINSKSVGNAERNLSAAQLNLLRYYFGYGNDNSRKFSISFADWIMICRQQVIDVIFSRKAVDSWIRLKKSIKKALHRF